MPGAGGREIGVTAYRFIVSFRGDENVLELNSGDGCINFEHTKSH